MTTDRVALAALLATMTVLGAAATPAAAQTEPAAPVRGLERLQNPGTQSSPDATAIPVPDAPTIVLPNINSAPRRAPRSSAGAKPATDRAANSGRATEGATRERAAARTTPESATQSRDPERDAGRTVTSAQPAPIATPIPAAAPQSQPAPTPVTETTPQPVAPTTATVPTAPSASTLSAPETGRTMPLWLSLTAIVVVLGALWALRRKPRSHRSDRSERETDVEAVSLPVEPSPAEPVRAESIPAKASASEPVPAPTAAIPAARAAASSAVPDAAMPAAAAAPKFLEPRAKTPPPPPMPARARLTCDLRPLRAGLNLLSATVECEMVVTNTGTAPAEGIRAGIALLTAHADQDVDLAAFNAAPVVRPATPPFTLAPGETRTIRTVTAIARDAIRTMTAANRPMFVPVVATNILYATAGDDAQTARAWVVGIERVDSAKLAPFWLDAPARMYTTVAARPHAVTFDR